MLKLSLGRKYVRYTLSKLTSHDGPRSPFEARIERSAVGYSTLKGEIKHNPPTVHKDLSLVSLVPEWSGAESAISLEEFFSSIEGSANIGHWAEADCL